MHYLDTRQYLDGVARRLVESYSKEAILSAHLELDGSPEDVFFEALTRQLAIKYPEEFGGSEEEGSCYDLYERRDS